MSKRTTVEGFWASMDKTAGEEACWIWMSYRNQRGYGEVQYQGRPWKAHRLAFVLNGGILEQGKIICHKCDNPPCCNPSHLYQGTHADNNQDKISRNRHQWSSRTHCLKGHEYTEENTQWIKGSRTERKNRRCATCHRINTMHRYWRSKTSPRYGAAA